MQINLFSESATKLLRREGQTGADTPGYFPNMIAVESNPLQDISELERVIFVMKGGEVVRWQEQ